MTKRVLIVEDEVLIRKHIGSMITKVGHTIVGETSSGEEAVELAKSLMPDLIFMDIRLSGAMSGIDAATTICDVDSAPDIVFASAYNLEDQIPKQLKGCTVKYLHKPVTPRALDLALAG